MNTKAEGVDLDRYKCVAGLEIHDLDKGAFDHAGTRAEAARKSNADVMIFMTQDAVPADGKMIENLLAPFSDDKVGVTYARQLPKEDCRIVESYIRSFNYPDTDMAKSAADLDKMGIKTYFCSDVCAAYRKDVYEALGGFEAPAIFNEDMVFAAKVIKSGRIVYYASGARVIHSHNYTNRQQFQRNFDLAVSQSDHPEIFADVKSESEGKKLVLATMGHLFRLGKPWLVFPFIVSCAYKYLGFYKGKHYQKLSCARILKYTSNPDYWLS